LPCFFELFGRGASGAGHGRRAKATVLGRGGGDGAGGWASAAEASFRGGDDGGSTARSAQDASAVTGVTATTPALPGGLDGRQVCRRVEPATTGSAAPLSWPCVQGDRPEALRPRLSCGCAKNGSDSEGFVKKCNRLAAVQQPARDLLHRIDEPFVTRGCVFRGMPAGNRAAAAASAMSALRQTDAAMQREIRQKNRRCASDRPGRASLAFAEAEIHRLHPVQTAHPWPKHLRRRASACAAGGGPPLRGRPVHRLAEVAQRLHDDLDAAGSSPSTAITVRPCRWTACASARCNPGPGAGRPMPPRTGACSSCSTAAPRCACWATATG
jgi:hypothetical protein